MTGQNSGIVVETVVECGNHLGESPLWCPESQTLFWINCDPDPALFRLDPASGAVSSWPMPNRIGAVALHDGSRVLVALRDGAYLFDLASASFAPVAANPLGTDGDLHEGKCDRQGRFWTGSISRAAPGLAGFYRLDDGLIRVFDDISVANSLAWSPDGRTLYHGDTMQATVWASDYDIDTGEAGPVRPFLRIPAEDGMIDGAAVDAVGNFWLALFQGACIRCYDPAGMLLRQIDLPMSQPTMAAFGGPDMADLYITSTRHGKNARELNAEPDLGNLFRIRGIGQGLAETAWMPPAIRAAFRR
ncbi:MAG: SMP-30/gluconolactonase/LRE family protein [Novosphingobium sp.]|nr:SMP-30/gluconolactonase/LRE family protein [Novosphingobium sp.]